MKTVKSTIRTWFIVYLLITGLMYGLNQWLTLYPIYVRTLILSGMMVFAVQYLVNPVLQKWKEYTTKQ